MIGVAPTGASEADRNMQVAKDHRRRRAVRVGRLVASIGVAAVAAAVIWGLLAGRAERATETTDDEAVAAPQRVTIIGGEPAVTLDTATQRTSGVETEALKPIAYERQLRAYGTVLDLEQLTELSNSYAAALAARQTADAKLVASRAAYERAKALYGDHQAMSAAQVQAAEATFRVDEAGVAAAESQLRTLTATAQQAWGPTLAQALVNRTPIFMRLINREDVLLQVTLPPGIVITKPPTSAFVVLADGSHAPLQFVSPATKTDPRIQGISFFYTAASTTGLLPGMSVLVSVPSDAAVKGVTVPPTAIVWWQGRAWVYIKTGPDRFARRLITTDLPTADGSYVARDVPAGTDVVTQGAAMLLSEELRGQIRASEN